MANQREPVMHAIFGPFFNQSALAVIAKEPAVDIMKQVIAAGSGGGLRVQGMGLGHQAKAETGGRDCRPAEKEYYRECDPHSSGAV